MIFALAFTKNKLMDYISNHRNVLSLSNWNLTSTIWLVHNNVFRPWTFELNQASLYQISLRKSIPLLLISVNLLHTPLKFNNLRCRSSYHLWNLILKLSMKLYIQGKHLENMSSYFYSKKNLHTYFRRLNMIDSKFFSSLKETTCYTIWCIIKSKIVACIIIFVFADARFSLFYLLYGYVITIIFL